jgi:putative SOS response-associated peptidase YedK
VAAGPPPPQARLEFLLYLGFWMALGGATSTHGCHKISRLRREASAAREAVRRALHAIFSGRPVAACQAVIVHNRAMCGRFTLTAGGQRVADLLGLDEQPSLFPRYNVAPTQPIVAASAGAAGARELATLRWGLPPAWSGGPTLINARAETVADKPAFRDAFRRRRCLVPMDGFSEWQKLTGGRKQPYHFRRPDGSPFAVAGLWEGDAGALLTTQADAVVAPVHDRMPLILPQADFALWLDLQAPLADLGGLIRPCVEAGLLAVAVGPWVNDARHEGPRCVEPATELGLHVPQRPPR